MKFSFVPKTRYEKFSKKIFSLLVENSKESYFVGGMVRDLFLGKKITDIDVATNLPPEKIKKILSNSKILFDKSFEKFGIIKAFIGRYEIEIATFRSDTYTNSRYPAVSFAKTAKRDSKRRDFTINALYFNPITKVFLDFYSGMNDMKNRNLRFIGEPEKRISEDPLRIIRALRFGLTYKLNFEKNTFSAIKKYLYLVKNISNSKIETEIKKIHGKKNKKIISEVINNPQAIDIYFKNI